MVFGKLVRYHFWWWLQNDTGRTLINAIIIPSHTRQATTVPPEGSLLAASAVHLSLITWSSSWVAKTTSLLILVFQYESRFSSARLTMPFQAVAQIPNDGSSSLKFFRRRHQSAWKRGNFRELVGSPIRKWWGHKDGLENHFHPSNPLSKLTDLQTCLINVPRLSSDRLPPHSPNPDHLFRPPRTVQAFVQSMIVD